MDKANKTSVNLNLKDFSDGPEDYINSRNKYIKISADEAGIEFVDSSELIHEAAASNDINRSVNRISQVESELQEMSIEHDILLNRASHNSNFIYDSFYDDSKIDHPLQLSDNPVEVMDDHDWNNNWKFDIQKQIYKQGFARPQKQYYVLELIDRYDLAGIGLVRKCVIDYDAVNSCYWFLSSNGDNTIGTITKLSTQLRNGKVEVIGQWYLAAPGTASIWWGGICSDGINLYIARTGLTTNSFVYCLPINSDGTLGVKTPTDYSKKNGETIALGTSTLWQHTNAITGYLTDVTIWDSTYIVGYVNTAAAVEGTLSMIRKSDGGTSPTNNITQFHRFAGGTNSGERSICRRGDVLWLLYNDGADDNRMIYKFNISTDIGGVIPNKKVFKCSGGRFRPALDTDHQANNTEGITIDQDGNIITVTSTASNGTQINKMAYVNTLWAENQVPSIYPHIVIGTITTPLTPVACTVEANRYYWTGDNGAAGAVDIYRFDTVTGTCKWLRITALESGTAWSTINDMTIDYANDKLYLLGVDSTNYKVYRGSLSAFVALMVDSGGAGPNITLGTTWGAAATGIGTGPGYTTTDRLNAIALNSDSGILYIINDTDQKIDTLSLNGATYTQGVYHLPARANEAWFGIAYKNGKIYINDKQYSGAGPSYLYVMDISRGTSTVWYLVHRYMDPSQKYAANSTFHGMAFDGNDLVVVWCSATNIGIFIKMKVLEDPDVIQLHTFINQYNNLLTVNVNSVTPIVKRYFEPNKFADLRDVPDQYYMGVTYNDEGFSILHLDEFLGDVSSNGKHRYDPRKIRAWHYKKSTPAPFNIVGITTGIGDYITIEKDMIFYGGAISSGTPFVMIDLKSGKAYYTHAAGFAIYTGTLTERNDGKGYGGLGNPELYISANTVNKTHAYTFTKNDTSDYSGEYPKTFVLINTDSGTDLLEIEWDVNSDRTLKKIWKNFIATAVGMMSGWIAPSGQIFIGRGNDTAGQIYSPYNNITNEPVRAWEVSSAVSVQIILNTYGRDAEISPNSRCWKTKSGQWRHQLLVGTSEDWVAAGTSGCGIVDIENKTLERINFIDSTVTNCYFMFGVDFVEDKVFFKKTWGTPLTTPIFYSHVLYPVVKRRFFTNRWTELQNNWDVDSTDGYYLGAYWSSPRFSAAYGVSLGGTGTHQNYVGIRYSMGQSVLANGQYAWGVQLFHYPWLNDSRYYGKEFEVSDPSEFIYKQSNIIPEV